MKYLNNSFVKNVHFVVLLLVSFSVIIIKTADGSDWSDVFHQIAFYLPAIAMLSVISGQIDLLLSMHDSGIVNLKARIYDFIHWLMLIGINIGVWLVGGVTIWWFMLKLLLLTVIGWQIGIGLKRKLSLKVKGKVAGMISAIIVFSFGLLAGYIRSIDATPLGWGWKFESLTAVIATLIVIKWIWHDIQTISETATGYPRMFFLKGIFCNFLIFLFWIHVMIKGGGFGYDCWIANFGLCFNTIVGNIIYLIYYGMYEYRRKGQKTK